MSRILIAIPTFENILPDTFKSVYGLEVPEGCTCQFDFVRGYHCAKARNLIAQEAIKYQFDYVLMVDSDVILPSNTLTSMLEEPVDICLGCYPRKNTQDETVELFKLGQKDFIETFSMPDIESAHGKIKVKGGGFGCALIRTEIFDTLKYPWFEYVEYASGDVLSEDSYFCDLASNAGYQIYADTDVICGHSIRGFQWR